MDANGNSEASIGWGSEFWLAGADGTLVELDEVTELPFDEGAADDVEVTHFKSPGKRKEYKSGLIEPNTSTLSMNYIPGSDTDVLIREAHTAGTPRAYREIIAGEDGKPEWQIDGFLIVKSRPRVVPIGDRKMMNVNVRFTGAISEAAPTAPGGGA
jgi:hypothetical protein